MVSNLQNMLCYFAQISNNFEYRTQIKNKLPISIPPHLWNCIDPLIDRDITSLIWHAKATINMTDSVLIELCFIYNYISIPTNTWSISIGHIIPRDPPFESVGN
jgi:hypothetical protein